MIGIEKLKAAAMAANQAWMDEPYEIEPALVLELIERLEAAEKQRDELLAKVAAWEQKAANWMASPEAAQQLDGYRDLAQRLNVAEMQRDELLFQMKYILNQQHLGHIHDTASAAIASVKEQEK